MNAQTLTTALELANESANESAKLRNRTLDSIWILALLAIFTVVFTVWFLQTLNFDLTGFAWTIAAIAAIQHAVTIVGARTKLPNSALLATSATQLVGIVGIALLWHLSGAMSNPMFLLFFAVPIIGAGITQQRWQLGGTLIVIIIAVIGVSLANSQLLRWYLQQRGVPLFMLESWGHLLPATVQPYPELLLPIGYQCVALAVFTVAVISLGLIAGELSAAANGRLSNLQQADEQLRAAQTLADNLVRKAPQPTVIIMTKSGQLVSVSDSLLQQYPHLQTGTRLADSVSFSHPEIIEQLLLTSDGECVQRIGKQGDAHFARVYVRHLGGTTPLALLSWLPLAHYELAAAIDVFAEPLILINSLQRVELMNTAARELFDASAIGKRADEALEDGVLPAGWWNPGRRSSSIMEMDVKQARYRVTCLPGKADGVADPFILLRFCPASHQAS